MATSKFDIVNSIVTWGEYTLIGTDGLLSPISISEPPAPNSTMRNFKRSANGKTITYDTSNEEFDFNIVFVTGIDFDKYRDLFIDLYESNYVGALTISNADGEIQVSYEKCELKDDKFLIPNGLGKDDSAESTMNFLISNDEDRRRG